MATKLPHVTITEIPNTSPGATPGLWNTRYYEINENFDALSSYSPVGDCSTAAGTAAKAVTITNFELSKNAFVFVKFSAANTAANPTLNVTGTGAKAIYYQGAAVPALYLEANRYYHFVYDGSHWVLTGDVDVRFRYLPLTGGTLTGDLTVNTNLTVKGTTSLQAVTANKALTAKAGITSNTLTVTGATTLEGALAAQGGIAATTITATGTTTLAGLNASNINASGTLTVNGSTTLKAVSATNVTASGTLAVTGTSTFTGKVTANGGLTTKALTATGLDLNGNADVSGTFTAHGKSTFAGVSAGDIDAKTLDTTGNVNVGGLLAVTGDIQGKGFVDTTNSGGEGFRLIDSRLDAVDGQNYRIQDWPVRVVDRDGRTVAMAKYVKDADGSSQFLLAEVTYSSTSDTSGNWAQITIGHEANGDRYFETALPTALTGGLTVSGGASLTGSVDVDGNITSDAAVTGHVLQTKETSGNVIRTLISGYSKGTKPSSRVTAYWGIYDKDGIGGNSDQVGAVSFGADTDGGTQMFMTAYRSDTSGLYPSSITVGWDSSNKAYARVTGSFTVGAELTVAKGITVTGGNVSISSGDFRTGGTCGVDIYDKTIDGTKAPSSTQQRWLARVLDVNEKTVGMLKVNQGTDGSQNIQIVSVLNSSDGSQKMNGLSVGYNANGDAFSIANTPENDSNGDNIATTKWVRAYNWDADRAQIVHTVNNETIDGTKTFKRSISVSANPLIQSTNWSGIGIADSTRSATTNKMMAQILDKDGKRFLGLEVTSGNDGSRQFQFNARNRNDNGWTIFLRCIEYADGTQNLTAGQHPPAGDNSLRLATTGWVVSQLSTSGEETHICNLDQARVFKRSGNHLCGSVHVQMFRSLDTTGTHTDDYGIYVGSSRVATVTVIFQANKGGSSGHGRSIDIQLSGSFEVSANVPAGSQITLRRDTSNIPGDMRHAFAHVTVSNA